MGGQRYFVIMRGLNKMDSQRYRRLFTSESVTEGHPDKMCDQISDAVLDAFLQRDPNARVACEVIVTTGLVLVCGEISSRAKGDVDIASLVRDTIRDIGYVNAKWGMDSETCGVMISIDEQSTEIADAVSVALESREGQGRGNVHESREGQISDREIDAIGAGDQGLVFGYASDETPELMPLPIALAHRLAIKLTDCRKSGVLDYLRPDGKTQVTIEYDEQGRALRVDTIVISAQHHDDVSQEKIYDDIYREVIVPVVPAELLDGETKYFINPTGSFVVGGPQGDAGLTGRKIIVDTYGGYARHGGGAFSGKDPTKVDRSGAYAARYVAKNIVAAGLAAQCEIQIAYAIGVAEPVSISVDTFGTGVVADDVLVDLIVKHFDLRPAGIIKMLDLRRPIYRQTSSYGHFGRTDVDLPWERVDKAEVLQAAIRG